MNTNNIDHIHKRFSCHSGAGISKALGKYLLSKLFIAIAASWILIGCGSSNTDESTVNQEQTNTPLNQMDTSQEQVDTPEEQAETTVNSDSPPATEQLPSVVQPILEIMAVKTFRFSWEDVALATTYRLLENADGISGFTQVGQDIPAGVESIDLTVAI